ncbi:hypothetical protein L3V86_08205 [Thiotrichales bacterium 19S11-10]|nr:hypothetical protein [Thiotrichales bacterium 19S11-10]
MKINGNLGDYHSLTTEQYKALTEKQKKIYGLHNYIISSFDSKAFTTNNNLGISITKSNYSFKISHIKEVLEWLNDHINSSKEKSSGEPPKINYNNFSDSDCESSEAFVTYF